MLPRLIHFPPALQLRARARSQALTYSFKQAELLAIYPSYRLYSSLPSLTPESPKTKVEPKPGPRPATVHAGTGKSVAAGPQPMAGSTQPKVEAAKSDEVPPSKIRMAIADVVKAAEAGALTPPPKDFGTRQIAKDIRARIREDKAQGLPSTMTWEEAHFVKTYQEDLVKLVPFLLSLLILEEALPLVVLYAPFLLPLTCILPNQRARILGKRDNAQYVARQEVRRIFSEVGPLPKIVNDGVGRIPEELVTGLIKATADNAL
ncbi:hypothetical protein FRC06_004527 [Ceratobasidium sp. 370]|nr:hypothetical protein FRC06_004527 [Ceratobasidium sp. 370]